MQVKMKNRKAVELRKANYRPVLLDLDEMPPRVWEWGGTDPGTEAAAEKKNEYQSIKVVTKLYQFAD